MPERGALGRWLAPTVTGGTLLAVGIVTIGLTVAVVTGASAHAQGIPLVAVLAAGGPASIVAAGLLALAVVPLAELCVGAVAFAGAGERRYLIITLIVLVLLLAGLVVGAAVGSAGG